MINFEKNCIQEIRITFFENNITIVFKSKDCQKVRVSDGFLVVETENEVYLYNCSAIKSIEVA